MVFPNGPLAARSGSTWIHWWSPVASANRLTSSWVMVTQSLCPMVSPAAAARSATDSKVRMGLSSAWVINIVPPSDSITVPGSGVGMIHLAHENDAGHLGRGAVGGGHRDSD